MECLHEVSEGLHTLEGHGIVDGGAHATHTAVTLELQQLGGSGLCGGGVVFYSGEGGERAKRVLVVEGGVCWRELAGSWRAMFEEGCAGKKAKPCFFVSFSTACQVHARFSIPLQQPYTDI